MLGDDVVKTSGLTYQRFTDINGSVCFLSREVDADMTARRKAKDIGVRRTFKIDPFLDAIGSNSRRMYRMPRTVTLDEMMIACKGILCMVSRPAHSANL